MHRTWHLFSLLLLLLLFFSLSLFLVMFSSLFAVIGVVYYTLVSYATVCAAYSCSRQSCRRYVLPSAHTWQMLYALVFMGFIVTVFLT